MKRVLPPAVAIALAFMASACGGRPDADPVPAPLAQPEGRIDWRGLLPCTDCDGIDTRLTLQWTSAARSYTLAETYLSGAERTRFEGNGEWLHEGGLLRLQGSDGERRTYAILDDGRLLPSRADGRRVRNDPHDVLVPVAVSGP